MSRTVEYDRELIRRLLLTEIGDGCREAPELGRRVAHDVAILARDALLSGSGDGTWHTLVGLASVGARYEATAVLKENALRVTRRGQTVSISGGYAVPKSIADPEDAGADLNEAAAEGKRFGDPRGNVYVQFDLMTWPIFFMVLESMRRKRGAYDAVIVTFEEVAKLHDAYPQAQTVGEACALAGFNLADREIDLDILDEAM